MSEKGKLQKLRGTRKVYLGAANNTERQITEITDSFDPNNETLEIQLTALKSSYQEKFNKIKGLDNEIINFPVDTRTKNVSTKYVHKRTFIFGSNWKHGKTSQSERLMNVPLRYVLKMSFSRPSFFFLPHSLENKNYKDKLIWVWQNMLTQMN